MKKLKYNIKEKELASFILNSLRENIDDYDYNLEIKGRVEKRRFIFKFKKKKRSKTNEKDKM